MDKTKLGNLHLNTTGDDGKTDGEHQLLFLFWQSQDQPNAVRVCVLEIRSGERTSCLVRFSKQTFHLANALPIMFTHQVNMRRADGLFSAVRTHSTTWEFTLRMCVWLPLEVVESGQAQTGLDPVYTCIEHRHLNTRCKQGLYIK